MIKTFADKRTSAMFLGKTPKGTPADLVARTQRKLAMIDQATQLEDLRVPPSNSLEALKGDRAGQLSIRVNDQWRICFVWQDGDAHDVEFCDYH
ncbi:type II toxin-antitoxin system RelE/ParE family toxin [Telmatospirillum sp.]|uniref:type II toxin-antitoxin system RelE/ParE family toxin n=1 Tax=Telmatospirillum sp. TaxID=2079197 RepID=UPI0028453130|nr:type II toxin-antitoxin system RelE/ParE family toxin [Telmatospirillum sp.]